jgi:hypothetical protein
MRTISDDPEAQRKDRPKRQRTKSGRAKKPKPEPTIIGVDGEGRDLPNGRHVYTYLAAVDEHGCLIAEAYNEFGLSHAACVAFLMSLPEAALKFGFMFSYDTTKIVEEMPPADIFYLMRPSAREVQKCDDCKVEVSRKLDACPDCGTEKLRKCTRPLKYGGRQYDFFNGSLSVSERVSPDSKKRRTSKIWDCFRFFGTSFVQSLKLWGVGSESQIARIQAMKDQRGAASWGDSPEQIKAYCQEECHLLALLMRKVKDAHRDAGIELARFDGAGSSASALLKANDVGAFKGPPLAELHEDLAFAIACAFFGGRFEDSVVGIVRRPIRSYDISSAYPFGLVHLPCLVCGKWRHVANMTESEMARIVARGGLVLGQHRVGSVPYGERREIAWAPLPCRDKKGSIAYGLNFTGWAWAPELLAALRGWPDLAMLTGEAWIYETPCLSSHSPFVFVPDVYRQRIAWGKEGPGLCLKLAVNACVTGDTLVRTADGEERIDALVGAGVAIVGADGELHATSGAHLVGEREVFRLRTVGDLELRLTADHLVLTENRGDVRAWELTVDDEIVTAAGVDSLRSFEAVGAMPVYDVTEIDTLHFVANGIVVHNCYGKLAQGIGDDPPYQSWVWAGMTTATTRGQLLDAIASSKDRWSVLAVATDGILSLEALPLKAPPRSTGTDDLAKPLGGWEHKEKDDKHPTGEPCAPDGFFIVKPGLYYKIGSELADVRARGVGRREVHHARQKLEDGFLAWDRADPKYHVELTSRRFYGAKNSVLGYSGCAPCHTTWPGVPEQGCPKCGEPGTTFRTSYTQTKATAEKEAKDAYGSWGEREVHIAFDPHPKREREGLSLGGTFARLTVRDLDGISSSAYDIGDHRTTPEGQLARQAREIDLEQPDYRPIVREFVEE